MPSMTIVVPHTLTQEEAMRRIRGLLTDVKAQHGDRVTDLEERWSGDRGEFAFKAMGFAVSGSLVVRPSEVELKGSYPLAALPFKGRIEALIRERATQLLAA
jgi:hypothetical protein